MYFWGMKVIVIELGFFVIKFFVFEVLERDLRKGWEYINEDLKKDYGEVYLKRGIFDIIFYFKGGRLKVL